jgi:hypothetical protein
MSHFLLSNEKLMHQKNKKKIKNKPFMILIFVDNVYCTIIGFYDQFIIVLLWKFFPK